MTAQADQESYSFQAEVVQILDLMIHSLYSNKEIFLRELVSNASDAIDRLRLELMGQGESPEADGPLQIRVSFDAEARTITIADNGIGMSRDEVVEHIGTIAKSGTREFLHTLTGDQQRDASLIGQFGVGFYSAFIVADHVVLTTRRAGLAAGQGVRWESDGRGEYTLQPAEVAGRGTTIELHLRDGEDELLNDYRLRSIIGRYSDHISLPILLGDEESPVNQASALWARSKSEISDQEYRDFYKHITGDFSDPLTWLHSKIEGIYEYTLLLFIPGAAPYDLWIPDSGRGVKLHVRRVFILEDGNGQLMPQYLRFIRGIIDSSDLPLNVSRELLQGSRAVSHIRSTAVKRILKQLADLAEHEPETYATFWSLFGAVLKEGVAEDYANRDEIAKLLRFTTTASAGGPDVSLPEYVARMKEGQDKIYYLLAPGPAAASSPHLEAFRSKGVEVLLLSEPVDSWVVANLPEFDGKRLQSVAQGVADLGGLADEAEKRAQEQASTEFAGLTGKLKEILGDEVFDVRVTSRLTSSPACIVANEPDIEMNLARRLRGSGVPSQPVLEINPQHPLVERLNARLDDPQLGDWAHVLYSQAVLTLGARIDDPAGFVTALNDLLGSLTGTGPAQMTEEAPAADELPFRYGPRLAGEIEQRWQHRWAAEGTFHTPNPVGPLAGGFERVAGRAPFYVLDMFPYPSGAGLHVGHPLGYIGTDVLARYQRMNGRHVMHALGYDAFGLPAEQYAIDTGQHPQLTTEANVSAMRRQLRRLGLGHDERREVATTDPAFYRWTQWIFLQIFNSWVDERTERARPIAELVAEFESGARAVPGDGPGDAGWAELDPARRRELVDGYRLAYRSQELVNWCPGLGTVLANEEVTPDGRSDIGNYPVYRRPLQQWMLRITAFAERLLADLDGLDWPESIKRRQQNWIGASDGAYVTFAVTGSGPGAGAVIEVFTTRPDTLTGATYLVLAPEHPLVAELIADVPDGVRGAVRAYQEATSRLSDRQRTAGTGAKTGVFSGRSALNPATGELIPIYLADYVLAGYGTGAIMAVPAHDERDRDFAEVMGLPVRKVDPARLGDLAGAIDGLEAAGHGRRARTYRLRDWQFSRQRYWGEPFPIIYDEHGPVALPESQLPVLLPEMTEFKPEAGDEDSDPVPPLARAEDWAEVTLDLGHGSRRYRRELNTMPQWAGSCWYYLRYLDPTNDREFVNPEIDRYWMVPDQAGSGDGGVGLYVGGVEHGVLHLLYARFWHKVLYDLGHVATREPFRRLVNQGYILADSFTDERGMYVAAAEVEHEADGYTFRGHPVTRRSGKMGKSLKNSVSPDDIYDTYGADTLRLYEMATGPLDADRPWHTGDIIGVHRFLQRLWRAIIDEAGGEVRVSDDPLDGETARRLHQTIAVVRADLEALHYNTAIARLMELTSHAARLTGGTAGAAPLPRALAEPLVLMTAPLAPHIAEELWQRLGHPDSLAYVPFPAADPALVAQATVELPVQVNGKVRFTVEVPAGAGEDAVRELVTGSEDFGRVVDGMAVRRIIVVPGRIVNVVTGPA